MAEWMYCSGILMYYNLWQLFTSALGLLTLKLS